MVEKFGPYFNTDYFQPLVFISYNHRWVYTTFLFNVLLIKISTILVYTEKYDSILSTLSHRFVNQKLPAPLISNAAGEGNGAARGEAGQIGTWTGIIFCPQIWISRSSQIELKLPVFRSFHWDTICLFQFDRINPMYIW